MTLSRQMPPVTPAAGGNRTLMILTTAITPVVWGTTYIVTTELLPPGPMFAGLMRALPAGLLALLLTRTLPKGSWWWRAAVLGTLNISIFFPMLFITAERLPGGVAATLGATQPIIVALLAVVVLSEKFSVPRFLWGIIGVLGVGLVVLGPGAGLDAVGIVAGLVGALSMGLGVTLTKRWGRPEGVSPMAYAGWQLAAGGLVLLVPTLLVEGVPEGIDAPAMAGYAWLGLVGGLLAYTLWFRGVRALPVAPTALLGLLSPLVAAAIGALVLGETFTLPQVLGFALALIALVAGQVVGRPRRTHQRHEISRGRPVDPQLPHSS